MPKTALSQLQEQVEAIRREAYAKGYTAAMQQVRDFTARPANTAEKPAAAAKPRQAPATRQRRPTRPSATATRSAPQRPQRGTNARLVAEVLQAIAPRAARPTEIRDALRRDKGVAMAFTSIRHALGQLEGRRAVEQVANSKTWRHLQGGGSASATG